MCIRDRARALIWTSSEILKLASYDKVWVSQAVVRLNCSTPTEPELLWITYMTVPSGLNSIAWGLSIAAPPDTKRLVWEVLVAVLISNGTFNEYSMTVGVASSEVTYTLVPSGFIKIPLKWSVSSEISFDCLNCKSAKELDKNVKTDENLKNLFTSLKEINSKLWVIEDNKRLCEKNSDFGEKFIKLSRDVHFLNDDRAKLKLEVNNHTGSKIKEIKEYTSY